MCRKHALENDTEEDQEISSETSLIKEHERLTAKYNSEKALLAEALKASQKEQSPGEESFSKKQEEEEEEDGTEEIIKEEEEEEKEEKEKEEADVPRFPKAIPLGPTSTEPKSMEQNVGYRLN